jgi:hypothetical protein
MVLRNGPSLKKPFANYLPTFRGADANAIGTFCASRLPTPSPKGGDGDQGEAPRHDCGLYIAISTNQNYGKKAHSEAQKVTEGSFDLHRHDDRGRPWSAAVLGSCTWAAKPCSPMAAAAKGFGVSPKASCQRFVSFRNRLMRPPSFPRHAYSDTKLYAGR